jgi:hypothetical protein
MTKIQLIGLPGAGKTTGITEYLKSSIVQPSYKDICEFSGPHREYHFRKAIQLFTGNLIAESACGVHTGSTYVVKYAPPIATIYDRLQKRMQAIDKDYLSLLEGQMIHPNRTINNEADLVDVLQQLFGDVKHVSDSGSTC